MDRIITLVLDPIFWFATIFIGFLLSIAANFATDGIKQFLGYFSARRRASNERERQNIEKEAQLCLADERYATLTSAYMVDANIRATEKMVTFVVVYFFGMAFYTAGTYTETPSTPSAFNIIDIISRFVAPIIDAAGSLSITRSTLVLVSYLMILFGLYNAFASLRSTRHYVYWSNVNSRTLELLREQLITHAVDDNNQSSEL